MTFIWPIMLWFLLLAPLFIFAYLRIQRRRSQMAEKYGSLGFVRQASGSGPSLRRHIPALLFFVGLLTLLFSLSRPETVVSVPKVEGTVILAFDVSGSMSAEDMSPTRMEAAKAVAKDFVLRQPPTVQIGVVAFSDDGFSVQAPTNDSAAILSAIDRLTPERGTSLANGILASLKAIAEYNAPEDVFDAQVGQPTPTPTPYPEGKFSSATIVLLTDGENNVFPDPLEAALAAKNQGVRIHTIGVGSPEGVVLEVNGFTVFTQLDEATLQQIAQLTSGQYYNAQTEEDLQTIYQKIEPQLVIKQEKTEITSILSGMSILILLLGGTLSMLWFSRIP